MIILTGQNELNVRGMIQEPETSSKQFKKKVDTRHDLQGETLPGVEDVEARGEKTKTKMSIGAIQGDAVSSPAMEATIWIILKSYHTCVVF